jgi:hypothetical protein
MGVGRVRISLDFLPRSYGKRSGQSVGKVIRSGSPSGVYRMLTMNTGSWFRVISSAASPLTLRDPMRHGW